MTVRAKEEEQSIDDNSFESDFENISKENLVLPVRTKLIKQLVEEGLDKWELMALDLLKYDYSGFKFD